MPRSQLVDAVLATVDQPDGCDDPLFVAATVQVLDRQRTMKDLFAVGRRLKQEEMSERDKAILKQVFRDCRRALTRVQFSTYAESSSKTLCGIADR